MKQVTTLMLFLVATLVTTTAVAKTRDFAFTDAKGTYEVGLRVVDQYDYSRTFHQRTDRLGKPYEGERARPIQTLIWYPARTSSARPMTVGDYVKLTRTETDFGWRKGHPVPPQYKVWASQLGDTKMAESMWARRDAKPVKGRFPLVVYAPSFSSHAWENADLCEYLASHGYVVIASPSVGAHTRDMTGDIQGIESQARDISFLIGYAHGLPDTDMSEVAVMAWSWGGISNLFAATNDSRIDALVDLDGSMRYFPGLVKDAGYVHPEQMTTPLLFFTEGPISLEKAASTLSAPDNTGPNILNEWTHGDLFTIHMLGMPHAGFDSMFQRRESAKNFSYAQKADYGRADVEASYNLVARYTLKFLDAYLKRDASAMTWLERAPAENGVPPHLMTRTFRAADKVPASMETFRAALHRQGFSHAQDIYTTMRRDPHGFIPSERAIESWAYDLMEHGDMTQSIAMFKFNAHIHTGSSDAYQSLGEAYLHAGNKKLAKQAFIKTIDLDPSSEAARAARDELKAMH